MNIAILLLGFAGLILGGEQLVRGAVSIASKFNVSTMLIGLTLVGFGTSMPELVTSVQAAMVGSPGIAVGNVVGSNIAKMLMAIRGWRITRREGALLVLGYVSYIGYRLRAPA